MKKRASLLSRYADYKPVPPPKTAVYKPVPPPKPKSYPPGSAGANTPHRTQSQPPAVPSTPEGNYMNSGQVNGHYQSSHHQHHQSQYATSGGYQVDIYRNFTLHSINN